MDYLQTNPLLYAGLRQLLRRDTAEALEKDSRGVFLRDTVSDIYMLAADDPALGERWLQRHERRQWPLLVLFQPTLCAFAAQRYGYTHRLDCLQAVYLPSEPPAVAGRLEIRPARLEELAEVTAHYTLLPEQEVREVIRRGELFFACRAGVKVGFAGRHPEGSMGMLEIYPEHRGRGYAAELEGWMIAHTLQQGMIPFCQVVAGNEPSLCLQKKLGLTFAEGYCYWLH